MDHLTTIEERQTAVPTLSGEGFFDWEPRQGKFHFSPSYFTILGYEPDELPHSQSALVDLVHRDDRLRTTSVLEEYLKGTRSSHEIVYRMKAKSGDYLWIMSRGRVTAKDALGSPIRIAVSHTDITVRKQDEEKLRTTELRLRSLIEQSSDAVFCYEYDPPLPISLPPEEQLELMYDSTLADCNLACARSYGAQRVEDVIGRKLRDLFGLTPGVLERLFRSLIKGHYRIVDGEATERLPDGSERHYLINSHGVIRDGKLVRIWGTFRDITKRKKTEQELERIQRLESLGTLAGGIAHDFNNLLAGVFGNIELARECLDANSQAAVYLDEARAAFLRATELTKQLLTFAKGGQPTRRLLSVPNMIQECIRLSLRGSPVEVELQMDGKVLALNADRSQMSQLLNSILINARQAMPHGGKVTIFARNRTIEPGELSPLSPGDHVELAITDSGAGIPADILPKVFDPYFTTKQQGSGLGLTIVHSIVAKHDGHVMLESEPGCGTTVRVILPAAAREEQRGASDRTRPAVEEGRILVMDDEPMVLNVAISMLKMLGYSAVSASNGEEAITLYRDARDRGKPFLAVILDLTIHKGMGGEEAMKALRQVDPDVCCIASSGYSNSPILANFRDYGFAGVIAKPYRIADLGCALERAREEIQPASSGVVQLSR